MASIAIGLQPVSQHTTFGWLKKESALAKDATTNQQRTLYSLRHTYATLSLMDGQMDMHTLAKQMDTCMCNAGVALQKVDDNDGF